MKTTRGQLVLLAAMTIVIVLLPMLTAVMQLGYHPDGPSRSVDPHPVQSTGAVLERAIAAAGDGLPTTHPWDERTDATSAVRASVRPTLAALNGSMAAQGITIEVHLNDSRAAAWASRNCPGGPGRDFGPCRTDSGIVLQNRLDRTHLVAVAVDILVVGPEAQWRLGRVIRRR